MRMIMAMMDVRRAAAAAALAAILAPGSASAASLSMNEVPMATGASMANCKAAGRQAIAAAGLQLRPESPASVFGAGPNGLIAAVYCLPHRGAAIVAIAGDTQAETRPALARIMAAMTR